MRPPRAWFEEPDQLPPVGFHVLGDGLVVGGQRDDRLRWEGRVEHFHTHRIRCADGGMVDCGPIRWLEENLVVAHVRVYLLLDGLCFSGALNPEAADLPLADGGHLRSVFRTIHGAWSDSTSPWSALTDLEIEFW
jgi:hypothetical protein